MTQGSIHDCACVGGTGNLTIIQCYIPVRETYDGGVCRGKRAERGAISGGKQGSDKAGVTLSHHEIHHSRSQYTTRLHLVWELVQVSNQLKKLSGRVVGLITYHKEASIIETPSKTWPPRGGQFQHSLIGPGARVLLKVMWIFTIIMIVTFKDDSQNRNNKISTILEH